MSAPAGKTKERWPMATMFHIRFPNYITEREYVQSFACFGTIQIHILQTKLQCVELKTFESS